jgi:flagellar hook-length control protein FliK
MLKAHQKPAAPPASAPAAPKAPERSRNEASNSAQKTPENQIAARAQANAQAHARAQAKSDKTAADSTGRSERSGKPQAAEVDAKDPAAAADQRRGTAEDNAAIDPALADWMARLNLPEAPAPEVATGLPGQPGAALLAEAQAAAQAPTGDAIAEDPLAAAGKDGAERGRARLSGAHDRAGRADASGAADSVSGKSAEATPVKTDSAAFQQEMARVQSDVAAVQGPPPEALRPEGVAGALGLGAASAAPSRGVEASAPVVVPMPTPADSPEFPQALGTQLSLLAKNGVQHAELHLNPADMGPISVQIELNGSQAQVNFGADSAATRDIIENGLPELAAAMREAGFTLSGGGVHQQAQGQRDGGDGARDRGAASGDRSQGGNAGHEEPELTRIRTRVSEGGVDLYA